MSEHQAPTGTTHRADTDRVAGLIERAFHYRGDVTIQTGDGDAVTGYLFNRNARASEPFAQLFETQTGREVSLAYRSITAVLFTGRDTAAAADRRFETVRDRQKEQVGTGERHGD